MRVRNNRKSGRGRKPILDNSGKAINSQRDITMIQEKILARKDLIKELLADKTVEELTALQNEKGTDINGSFWRFSSTDRTAIEELITDLKLAKELADGSESNGVPTSEDVLASEEEG